MPVPWAALIACPCGALLAAACRACCAACGVALYPLKGVCQVAACVPCGGCCGLCRALWPVVWCALRLLCVGLLWRVVCALRALWLRPVSRLLRVVCSGLALRPMCCRFIKKTCAGQKPFSPLR